MVSAFGHLHRMFLKAPPCWQRVIPESEWRVRLKVLTHLNERQQWIDDDSCIQKTLTYSMWVIGKSVEGKSEQSQCKVSRKYYQKKSHPARVTGSSRQIIDQELSS